jgi:iron only hydrogenase large subunit-like protein/uncharacterized Fe-S cluster-containing protein
MEILQFDKLHCKNCYKCVRHCPVKAIEVRDHRAQINQAECILCGECTIICPQKTKGAVSETAQLQTALRSGKKVIASIAPSCSAYFGASYETIRENLLALNFTDAFETAEGAYLVKSAYEKLVADHPDKVWISSSCSAVNLLVGKYYPTALPHLAPILTPIQAHAKYLKQKYPEAQIAFITPCVAKKAERYAANSQIDYVISFEEMEILLQEAGLELPAGFVGQTEQYLSRKFPADGGIVATMERIPAIGYASVSGYTACKQALQDIQDGKITACFVEMSLCEGSCIGGPSFRKKQVSLLHSALQLKQTSSAADSLQDYNLSCASVLSCDFSAIPQVAVLQPSVDQIAVVLRKMGKQSVEDELNCGMCGYHSCRDKAVAILAGKAEINMCLPFMNERAESFSNQIINITPNAILSVDMDLKVQQINQAACEIFRLAAHDVIKQPVSRILDEFDFVEIIMQGKEKLEKTTFLPEYNAYLNQVFLFDKESSMVVCIMQDISRARQKKNLSMKKKVQAAALADEIVDKQLRIVHEIASLLGETAAETQIAVRDLKETIMMDDEE